MRLYDSTCDVARTYVQGCTYLGISSRGLQLLSDVQITELAKCYTCKITNVAPARYISCSMKIKQLLTHSLLQNQVKSANWPGMEFQLKDQKK